MPRKIDWENQIGRRLRLRDLHVFVMVAQRGSMAKAALQLGVTTPTVSEISAQDQATLLAEAGGRTNPDQIADGGTGYPGYDGRMPFENGIPLGNAVRK
jgi:hypothetical protein